MFHSYIPNSLAIKKNTGYATVIEVRVHPVLSSCNRLLQFSYPPDNRYVFLFWRHVRTEAMHIIRVDREARIALYISYRHRICHRIANSAPL